MIDLLGRAGCVSIEAGVESITEEGRAALDKKCKMSTDELADRLIYAKQRVPFVQANLIEMEQDDRKPSRPFPGAPDRQRRLGQQARTAVSVSRVARLHQSVGRIPTTGMGTRARLLPRLYDQFSDIQEARPMPLHELELQETSRTREGSRACPDDGGHRRRCLDLRAGARTSAGISRDPRHSCHHGAAAV